MSQPKPLKLNQNKPAKELELADLNQQEKELIFYIRTRFKFGDIVIQTRDGAPYRILKVTEFQALNNSNS